MILLLELRAEPNNDSFAMKPDQFLSTETVDFIQLSYYYKFQNYKVLCNWLAWAVLQRKR